MEGAQRCAASFALFQTAWSCADIDGDDAMASLTWYVHNLLSVRISFERFKSAFIVTRVEREGIIQVEFDKASCTASSSLLRTMLLESSSGPLPAKRANHAT